MARIRNNGQCWALGFFVLSLFLLCPLLASAQTGISLAGVHWYSGDSGLLDMSIPAGQRGWNVEAIYDSSSGGGSVKGNAQRAKDHGLINIIRIDYRNYQAVPKSPGEYEKWTNDFKRCISDLSDLASIFIVGNEPNVEGEITAQQYADAFNHLYARKPQGVSILVAGPSGFSPPQWLGDVSSRISGTDGFALHTYGDPTSVDLNTGRRCQDPRQPCKRSHDWNFDGGFQYFRDLINQIPSRFWSKPTYFTEFNTDVNGTKKRRQGNDCVDRAGGYPDPIDNYQGDWINNAFQAIRDYNAGRGSKPEIKALVWYVDRDDSGGCEWAGFALRNIGAARDDMAEEFKNPANRGGAAPPPPSGSLSTGWEDGEAQSPADQIMYSQRVSGAQCRRASGTAKSGTYALMIAGTYEAGYAYCYHRIFDVDIPITSGTKIGYWIYQAEGTRQIGIDGHLDNGETLRDFNRGAIRDRDGVPIHPNAPRGMMNQWHYVEVDLSPAAGRRLKTLLLAFDKGNTTNQGRYKAYVDELRVFTGSTPPPVDDCIASVSADRWKGEYFKGKTLGSSPAMVRDDTAEMGKANGLAKNWGGEGPNRCGIGTEEFSVRWSKRVTFEVGTYEFLLNSDDGTKLYLNDQEILANWFDQGGGETRTVRKDLQAGDYTVKLEFYENRGGALVDLRWNKVASPPPPSGSLSTGWEDGEPQGLANQIMYSQKVSGTQCQRASGTSHSGNYAFMITGTYETGYAYCYHRIFDVNIPITSGTKIGYWIYQAEGTRQIGIDGHLDNGATLRDFNNGAIEDQNGVPIHPGAPRGMMNQWHYVEVDLSPAAGRALKTLLLAFDKGNTPNPGRYKAYVDELRVFTGSTPPPIDDCIASVSSDRWKGEYFKGKTLGSSPAMIRDDTAEMGKANGLAKNWGGGGPNRCGIGTEEFSARWTKRIRFEAGTYEFLLNSDDGTKLYLNDRQIISNWLDQDGSQTRKERVDFPQAGDHTVKLEFYENRGGALVDLRWNKVASPPPSVTFPLNIRGGQSASGISEGLWITQCTSEGWERVWRVNSSREQAVFQYPQTNHDCGTSGPFGIYPLVFRDANVQSGTWITWCTGNGNDQFVWQADGSRFAPFKWPESNSACSSQPNPNPNPTPNPTPTPGKSKLTIHTEWDPGQRSLDFINTAKPAVVKIMSNTGVAQEIKRISPNTLVVGRIYLSSQPMGGDARQRALDWWNAVKDRILASPQVDYWEGYNEPGSLDQNQMRWYADFEAERVRILAQHGKKACIGNFAEGNPDVTNPDIWPAFYPAIDEALRHGGVLGLHEYSAPNMQQDFDERTGEGWHTGRYRKVYRQFLIPAGKKIPLVITECGIDGGANRTAPKPYCGGDGWRCYQTATDYFNQLKWYDNILKQDDYVLGATIFTLDQSGNMWDSFEIDDDTLLRLLKDHVK